MGLHDKVSGDIVFIQMVHPSDKPGRLNHQRDLCLARIRARGEGELIVRSGCAVELRAAGVSGADSCSCMLVGVFGVLVVGHLLLRASVFSVFRGVKKSLCNPLLAQRNTRK